MNQLYIIFILYSIASITFSSGEEVHAEEPTEKSVKSSYTYSIEYSDAGNHGKYGHKIEVTDGNAKVNVHSEHPQIEEQIDQHKIRPQPQSKPNHVKQQVLAYVPAKETQNVVPQHKQHHPQVQLVQVQKAPSASSGKLPIDTLDKHQLAVLLAQNKNPFLPVSENKGVAPKQHQKPGHTKNGAPENQHTLSYYVPQGNSNYQPPAQSSKDTLTYGNPKLQYTYQYQPSPVKVQYASIPNQQQYYYPETTQLNNNHGYQNYYQQQIPATTHKNVQPQIQYTAPFAQQQIHQQEPQQQYVYLPQTISQTSGGHAQQYSFNQLQGGNQNGPVQFLPSDQSQNSHTYPTTPLYNIPKAINIPSGTPEMSGYPASLFSNIQYGSSIYGSSAGYGTQPNIEFKSAIEIPQTGKANQYGSASQGINYGSPDALHIGNEIQSGLFKNSAQVQDTKSSNFYATTANLPQGKSENFAPAYQHYSTHSNVAYKQGTTGPSTAQHSIDYSQLGHNTNQIQYPTYYSNQLSNEKQQITYVPGNTKTNIQYIPSKQVPSHETGATYVKVQKSNNFGAHASQYYNPNSGARHAENNVRYVYVQANGVPIPEEHKVSGQ